MRASHLLPFVLLALTACKDPDGDGFAAGRDCAPYDPAVHPDAEEVCNGVDDDCDGFVDEEVALVAYWDRDGDGYGDPGFARRVCELPEDGSLEGTDCDDLDPLTHPAAEETCDGRDEDCDGKVDEDALRTFYLDEDGDGRGVSTETVEACTTPSGYASTDDDCDDADPLAWTDAEEQCDEQDNDCDGEVDEDLPPTRVYVDKDGDGHGEPGGWIAACGPTTGYSDDNLDCDDEDPAIGPHATEIAGNGVDEDCDGWFDEIAVPDHHATLAEALAVAADGDVVQLGEGVYFGTVDLSGRDLTLAGEGCDTTVLYADGAGTTLTMTGGVVADLTLATGLAEEGGGLRVEGDVAAMEVCVESSAATVAGGGVAVLSGSLLFQDGLVRRNQSEGDGGGIYVAAEATLQLVRSRVLSNVSSSDGGGLHLEGATAEVASSVFAGNTSRDGGGIAAVHASWETSDGEEIDLPSTLTGTNLSLVANVGTSRGQALFVQASTASLNNLLVAHHDQDDNTLIHTTGSAASTSLGTFLLWGNEGDESPDGHLVEATRVDPDLHDFDPDTRPSSWDLRLGVESGARDAGDASLRDPDGSRSDIGAYAGPEAPYEWNWTYGVDEDLDGMPDGWEDQVGLNPWFDEAADDLDGDGLSNLDELHAGTDPAVTDSDADGVDDGTEAAAGDDPADPRDHLPVADAGADDVVMLGDAVWLDASASWDPNADALSVAWTLSAPGTSALTAVDDPSASSTSFTPDVAGTYTVTLTVDDGSATRSDDLEVLVVDALVVPDDVETVQEAIEAVGSGGWIALQPGTYLENLETRGADVGLLGLGDAEDVILDAGAGGPVLAMGYGETVTLARVTLTGGASSDGAGVYMPNGGTLTLWEAVIEGNDASGYGGGVFASEGAVALVRSTVRDNLSTTAGGGLALVASTLDATGSRLVDNESYGNGGALYLTSPTSGRAHHHVENSVIQGNRAPEGAAIWRDGASAITTLLQVAVVDQLADGSVLYCDTGRLTLVDALVAWNRGASVYGDGDGGVYDVLYPLYWEEEGTRYADAGDDVGTAGGVVEADPLVVTWLDDGYADDDHLAPRPGSPLLDAGFPEWRDPDGSRADIGPWGGPGAPISGALFSRDDDGDGLSDGWELLYGLDRERDDSAEDPDGDGLTNAVEYASGTDPGSTDTDRDGVDDATELAAGDDPADPSDHRPTADAGSDLRGEEGTTLTLDGSGSFDPNGDALTYRWSFVSVPSGSALTDADLDGATTSTVSFVPDARKTWRLQLVVSDGAAESRADPVTVQVYGELHVPDAFATVEEAVDDLVDDDTIVLAAGTHTAWVDGSGASFTIRGEDRDSTVLEGSGAHPVVVVDDGEQVTLEALTIRRGITTGSGAGGLDCTDSTVVATDVLFEDHVGYNGGAVALDACEATFTDVDVRDAVAEAYGGGVHLDGGALTWTRGDLAWNEAGYQGAGIYVSSGDLTARNLVFRRNLSGSQGAAIYSKDGTLDAAHLTIAGNAGTSAPFYVSGGSVVLTHSIFEDNASSYGFYGSSTSASLSYNGWYGYVVAATAPTSLRSATAVVDSADFVTWDADGDGSEDDLRLRYGSPMIDAGDPSGDPDPDGSTPDIGAYGGPDASSTFDDWYEDADADGMADGWEGDHGLDPTTDDGASDPDGDGLTNLEEFGLGTDPASTDSDGDGVSDAAEVSGGTDPAVATDHRPVADAGSDTTSAIGATVTLDGSGSSDPNGDALGYTWTLEEMPGRSALTDADLSGASSASATFTPDTGGLFVLRLVVDDGAAESEADTVEVRVEGDLVVPDDYADLGEAIEALTSGFTITIDAGIWPLNADLDGKDVVLQGAGRDLTFLDGEDEGSVLVADDGETVELYDLTVTGGFASSGGGLRASLADILLGNVAFAENEALQGGGLHASVSTVTGTGVRFVNNLATRYGGGIYASASTVALDQVLLAGNTAVTYTGGGVHLGPGGSLDLTNAVVHENLSGSKGGGVYVTGTSGTSVPVGLAYVTATWNEASQGSFFGGNNASVSLTGSIVAHHDSYALQGNSASTATQDYTLLYDNDPASYTGITAPSGTGNLTSDPRFADVDDDGDWTDDDWTLSSSSPAVDAGDPSESDPDGSDADMGAFGGSGGDWEP